MRIICISVECESWHPSVDAGPIQMGAQMETLLDSLISFYASEIRKPTVVDATAPVAEANVDLGHQDASTFPYLP